MNRMNFIGVSPLGIGEVKHDITSSHGSDGEDGNGQNECAVHGVLLRTC